MDFQTELNRVYTQLGAAPLMVLATCSENRPTARMMSCVIYDGKIVFQTATGFLKFRQMEENPWAALCTGNIQIEGTVRITGHPFDEGNSEFARLYQTHHRGSWDTYSHMKTDRVCEVSPTLITLWCYEQEEPREPYRIFLDMLNGTVRKEMYDHS